MASDARREIPSEEYVSFFRKGADCFWITDIGGNFLEVNEAFSRAFGYGRDELRAMNIADLDVGRAPEATQDAIARMKAAKAGRLETIYKTKGGSILDVEVSAGFDEAANVIFGMVRDVTHRKKVELDLKNINEELREAQHAMSDLIGDSRELAEELEAEKKSVERKVEERTYELREEKARLLASIRNLPVGFGITNTEGAIIVANPLFSSLLGGASMASLQDFTAQLTPHVAEQKFDLAAAIRGVAEKQEFCEIKSIQFQERFLHLFISPILLEQEAVAQRTVIGLAILIEDITEEKRLEIGKNSFVAITSHELRTPLSIIRANAELMLEDPHQSAEARDMTEAIHRSTIRLLGIVNDFLDVSALEERRMPFKREAFPIEALVQEVVGELRENAQKKSLALSVEPSSEPLPFVTADRNRLKEAVMNIVSNAIQYTEKGSIVVRCSAANKKVKIAVTDTGVGIPVSSQGMLFQRFQTVGSRFLQSKEYGSGMGLYITRLLLRAMGGDVILETSEPGKGSTFSIFLDAGE